jgi:hypothetical protein
MVFLRRVEGAGGRPGRPLQAEGLTHIMRDESLEPARRRNAPPPGFYSFDSLWRASSAASLRALPVPSILGHFAKKSNGAEACLLFSASREQPVTRQQNIPKPAGAGPRPPQCYPCSGCGAGSQPAAASQAALPAFSFDWRRLSTLPAQSPEAIQHCNTLQPGATKILLLAPLAEPGVLARNRPKAEPETRLRNEPNSSLARALRAHHRRDMVT